MEDVTLMLMEVREALCAPFSLSDVQWRLSERPRGDAEFARVVAYVHASRVADRLDAVVGFDWSHRYEVLCATDFWAEEEVPPVVLRCDLTVKGVTRSAFAEDSGLMAAEGRAFKRAAALWFGVGRFLYSFPVVYARVRQTKGGSWVITAEAREDLAVLTSYLMGKLTGEDVVKPDRFENLWVFSDRLEEREEERSGVGLRVEKRRADKAPEEEGEAGGEDVPKMTGPAATVENANPTLFWGTVYAKGVEREEATKIVEDSTVEGQVDWSLAYQRLVEHMRSI